MTKFETDSLPICHGKQKHKWEFAESIAKKMRRKHNAPIQAYFCSACDGWHVGEVAAFCHNHEAKTPAIIREMRQEEAHVDRRPVPANPPNLHSIDMLIAHGDFEHIRAARQLCADGHAYLQAKATDSSEREENPYVWRLRRIKAWCRVYGNTRTPNKGDDVQRADCANQAVDLSAPYSKEPYTPFWDSNKRS